MSDNELIAAHTNAGAEYPAYINFGRTPEGKVHVIMRGNPTVRPDGRYICGYARDKGKPGRCTSGDERCNNYCNTAPEKGPMQDHPLPCVRVIEGTTSEATFSAEEFAELISTTAVAL